MSWRDQPRDRRGRWTKKSSAWTVAATAVVALVASGAGSAPSVVGGSAGGGTSVGRSVAEGQGKGGQGKGQESRSRGRERAVARALQRLRARGLRVAEHVRTDTDCVSHSYGQVHEFFRQHPCRVLNRALFEVRDGPLSVVVAFASVDMPDEAEAGALKELVDRHGTGNLTELTKEGVPPRSTTWTGAHYRSTIDGVTVVNVQTEPTRRTAQAVRLAQLAAATAVS